jgi:hypothetical protein
VVDQASQEAEESQRQKSQQLQNRSEGDLGMVKKKVIWYREFDYDHPRKTGDQSTIWKPIVVSIKVKEDKQND